MALDFNIHSQIKSFATVGDFPTTGEAKTIYIALDSKLVYIYDSGAYTSIGDSTSAEWGHISGDITSQTDLQTVLDGKFNNPSGNTTQYLDGAGTPTTFPTMLSADKMVTIGRNATGSTLYKGTIVYISGSTGNRPNFVKAQANAESTSAGTFGVIEADIPNNADGNCVTIGTIDNLDTRSSATHPFTTDTLADGDTIYLSPTTAGYITNVKPYAPSHLVYIGKVVRTSPTNGTIVYRIQNGYELDELHDVAAQTPTDGQVLQYESATSLWKPKTISTGITIGTTAITSGTVGRVLFEGTGNVVSESANLFWDNTNGRLGIGGTPSTFTLDVNGTSRVSGALTLANGLLRIDNTAAGSNVLFRFLSTTPYFYSTDYAINFGATSNGGGAAFTNGIVQIWNQLNLNNLLILSDGNTTAGERLRVTKGGNVLINTTTDAGFKLDVNGTARVSGDTIINNYTINSNGFLTYLSGTNPLYIQTGAGGGSIILRPGTSSGLAVASTGTTIGSHTLFQTGVLSQLSNSDYRFDMSSDNNTFYYQEPSRRWFYSKSSGTLIQNISYGGNTISTSALLEIQSVTKGFLPPRMTTTQKNAITSPATGLQVFDTTLNQMSYYNGTTWINL